MTDKKTERPDVDSPEFKEWLLARAKNRKNSIFGDDHKATQFDERDAVCGDINDLDKTDAELFPDELEEYTPEERRKLMKLHKSDTPNLIKDLNSSIKCNHYEATRTSDCPVNNS